MGFFKDLLRHTMGGHHGGGRYGGGHHGGYDPNYRGQPSSTPPSSACPKCGASNAASARFCQQCGASMVPAKCASCAAEIPPGAKFCPQCGKPA
ncbi:zinc-ribbon domain-containing protein [Stutzerimonas balearica]|uniref:zinc-ribbon domain-containing protein n=1 Tax=Stutzerimonas balearica TaxID=74829 RepID=UPI002F263810